MNKLIGIIVLVCLATGLLLATPPTIWRSSARTTALSSHIARAQTAAGKNHLFVVECYEPNYIRVCIYRSPFAAIKASTERWLHHLSFIPKNSEFEFVDTTMYDEGDRGDDMPPSKTPPIYGLQSAKPALAKINRIDKRLQALKAKSHPAMPRLSFQPQGSPRVVGTWGINRNIIIGGGNMAARNWYLEYRFHADGSFEEQGADIGAVCHYLGFYRLDGTKLWLVRTKAYVDNRGHDPMNEAESYDINFSANDGRFPTMTGILTPYWKGLRWDFNRGYYCDEYSNRVWFEGEKRPNAATPRQRKLENRFGETDFYGEMLKDPFYHLFPYDSGDFQVWMSYYNDKPTELIFAVHHQIPSDDPANYQAEEKLKRAAAKRWVAKHRPALLRLPVRYVEYVYHD